MRATLTAALAAAIALQATAQEETLDLEALLPQLLALPGAAEIVAQHRPEVGRMDAMATRLEESFAARDVPAELEALDCDGGDCAITASVPREAMVEGTAAVESWIAVEQPCAYEFRQAIEPDRIVITARTRCEG